MKNIVPNIWYIHKVFLSRMLTQKKALENGDLEVKVKVIRTILLKF